jgi:hypothetical protein
VVQLKGEEEILSKNENMHRIISKLDEYKAECKNNFAKNEHLSKLETFKLEKEASRIIPHNTGHELKFGLV